MNFFQSASMGFDKDAIVTVPIPNDRCPQTKVHALKLQLLQQFRDKRCESQRVHPDRQSGLGW